MSLPQSALPFSSHLIIYHPTVHPFTGYTSPLHRLNHLYILHSLFALCTNPTHTSTITLSLHYPHKHKNTIFLHYPHQQHKNTFLLDIDTVTIIAFCTIG